jgi:SNF2 family DNA or RNA helicase
MENWSLEFEKWAPAVNVVVYRGLTEVRKEIFANEVAGRNFNVV